MSEHQPPGPSQPSADPTGDERVDAALTPLDALDDVPIEQHPAVVEDVHRELQDILAEERE